MRRVGFLARVGRVALSRSVVMGCSVVIGCSDDDVTVRDIELRVAGSRASAIAGRDGWTIELETARVAFGPLTLCPGRSAGEFCETARGEWVDAVVVDALEPRAKRAGYVVGTAGPVLSFMYDYGIVSLLTRNTPYITDAARELDGNSIALRGCATKLGQEVCFTSSAPVAQTNQTERGVPVVRVGGLRGLTDLTQISRLTVTFDPASWVSTIDFDAVAQEFECEERCDVELMPGSQAVRALQTALAGSGRPVLTWSD